MTPYQVARRSKTALVLLVTLIATTPLMAQNNRHELSAQQSVEYALKNSAKVKNALTDVKIQFQDNRDVTSAALPQITGNVNATKFLDIPTTLLPGEVIGQPAGTFLPVQFGTKYTGGYGIDLHQLLFDGQVFVGLQARATSIDWANLNVAVTEEQIKANVYKVYYQLVVGKKQLEITDVNIARLQKLLNDTRELYKNGFQEKLDVDKLLVNLSNLTTQRVQLENQLKTGYVGLKYLMGMPVKEELILTDTLNQAILKEDILNEDTVRYEDRKEFQLLQTTEKLRNYNIKRYKLAYIPTVALSASYGRNAQRQSFNFFKKHEDWFTTTSIGLRIDVPIFDGFSKDAKIKKARLELEKTRTDIADLKNNIDNEVLTARLKLRDAILTMDEQTKNMALAETVYNQTKKKYEQGLGSNLEVTNAETELKTAQNNYFSAIYDAIIAKVDYQKATGKLQ